MLGQDQQTRPFITFLLVHDLLRPGYDYLVNRKLASLLELARGTRMERDLSGYQQAAARDGKRLSPSRKFDPRPLNEPPYYVVEAAPAITFTLGGLLIGPDARVRARDGGTVPGLLAAGADAGRSRGRARLPAGPSRRRAR